MSDSKKYYYIRLKEGFFESNELLLLQSQKDGYIYSDIATTDQAVDSGAEGTTAAGVHANTRH